MSKIICDVCGTSYQETATQCPICGCVRPSDVVVVNNDIDEHQSQKSGTYTYVKGGRFSKANVKKRNLGMPPVPAEPAAQKEEPEQAKGKSDKGLIIAVCALLLAIIAVVIYIALHFFAPGALGGSGTDPDSTGDTTASTTENTQSTTSEPTVLEIPCVDIVVSKTVVALDKVGAAHLLNVTTNPGNTTDPVIFTSSDDTVATVSDAGKIEAVGPGQAVITITCGSATAECRVQCDFETIPDETVETTENTTPATDSTNDFADLKLNWTFTLVEDPTIGDVTLKAKDEVWVAYTDGEGKIPSSSITFTSSDTSVVTIDAKGVVKAVGKGQAMITAEYQGIKVKCRIICIF